MRAKGSRQSKAGKNLGTVVIELTTFHATRYANGLLAKQSGSDYRREEFVRYNATGEVDC